MEVLTRERPLEAEASEPQSPLAALIDRLVEVDGSCATPIAALTLFRSSVPYEGVHAVQSPSLCIIAQGAKEIRLGSDVYVYDRDRYLLTSVDLPIIACVMTASRDKPYLGARIDLDVRMIDTLLMDTPFSPGDAGVYDDAPDLARGLAVGRVDGALRDAVMRLLRLLDSPRDIGVLEPLIMREILYRLLIGDQGARLLKIARDNSRTQRIANAIAWLKLHYAEPLRIEDLAREACMSASGLYHHFRAVTAMSPLQYQKCLRLQEARRLMVGELLDAATAGYRVGYASASQFSREYSRLFGEPPHRNVRRLRGTE